MGSTSFVKTGTEGAVAAAPINGNAMIARTRKRSFFVPITRFLRKRSSKHYEPGSGNRSGKPRQSVQTRRYSSLYLLMNPEAIINQGKRARLTRVYSDINVGNRGSARNNRQ